MNQYILHSTNELFFLLRGQYSIKDSAKHKSNKHLLKKADEHMPLVCLTIYNF